jgi:hypothetical protein
MVTWGIIEESVMHPRRRDAGAGQAQTAGADRAFRRGLNVRRTPWCCVWGVALTLLAGGALPTSASAQGTVKGGPGLGAGPAGTTKAGVAKPRAAEKRITFSMGKKPWQGPDGVLNWLSNQLGIPLVASKYPTGSFNFTPPVVNGVAQTYTLPEVVDLINQELQREKWVLLRYRDHFTVLPSEAELPNFPRIELDELAQRGRSEVVSLVYPLRKLNAAEFAPEVQKMLTQPFGKVLVLESSNRLILQDSVQSLKQVDETIRGIEGGLETGRWTVLYHACQYQLASQAAEHLKQLLGEEKEEVQTVNPKGEKKIQYRVHKISVDDASNSVLVTGPADKLAKAREILKNFDTGREKVAVGQPFLKMYPIAGGNAEALTKILQEVYKSSAGLKISAINSTTIAVWAGPEMQIRIAREIMPGPEKTPLTTKTEFIPLNVAEAEKIVTFLQNAFPSEKGKSDGPVIDADIGRNGILVRGTEQQVQEVRKAIAGLEGQDESAPGGPGMRVFNLEPGDSAAVLAEALKAAFQKIHPDRNVKLILPGHEPIKPAPEKKPEPPKQLQKTGRSVFPISAEAPRLAGRGAGSRVRRGAALSPSRPATRCWLRTDSAS